MATHNVVSCDRCRRVAQPAVSLDLQLTADEAPGAPRQRLDLCVPCLARALPPLLATLAEAPKRQWIDFAMAQEEPADGG